MQPTADFIVVISKIRIGLVMDSLTFIALALVVLLAAVMTADLILDVQSIWDAQFDERGSGRVEVESAPVVAKVATLDWVQMVEDELVVEEVDVIQLAKSRQRPRIIVPTVQAGVKVRELLDNLGRSVQQLIDYSQLTIRELKEIAKQRRLPKYGSMRKAELIAALQS